MSEGWQKVRSLRIERTLEIILEEGPCGAAEPALRRARRDIARTLAMRQDLENQATPCLASEICRGILAGEWRVTDHFEGDLRRFIIAERCRRGEGGALTERERQVLAFTLEGHSNKYVALELGLTPSTIATHLRRVMQKIGVPSREALIQALPLDHRHTREPFHVTELTMDR